MVSEPLGRAVSPERLFLDSPPQALPLSLLFEWVERQRHVLAPRPQYTPTVGRTLESVLAAIVERESGTGDQVLHGPGDEDLRRPVPRLSTW